MPDAPSAILPAYTPPTPPTPGGAAPAAPSAGDAPGAVLGAWSGPTPPTPSGAAPAAPSAGDAPGEVLGAWSAPTPPTPSGAAPAAPVAGAAPGAVGSYSPPTAGAPEEIIPSQAGGTMIPGVTVAGTWAALGYQSPNAFLPESGSLNALPKYTDGITSVVAAYPDPSSLPPAPLVWLVAVYYDSGLGINTVPIAKQSSGSASSYATPDLVPAWSNLLGAGSITVTQEEAAEEIAAPLPILP